ncbi:MAG: hypothetical protein ACJAS5_000956, partial [Lentimonas sp.]
MRQLEPKLRSLGLFALEANSYRNHRIDYRRY